MIRYEKKNRMKLCEYVPRNSGEKEGNSTTCEKYLGKRGGGGVSVTVCAHGGGRLHRRKPI